jgi:hypothetical protein
MSMLRDLHASTRSKRSAAIRRRLPVQRLLPIEPVHADHQPLLVLPPDDVGSLHVGILDMRGNHREVVGIECHQFELRCHRSKP